MYATIKSTLLRDLALILFPLMVFTGAYELINLSGAVYLSIGCGFGILVYAFIRSGRFEKIILLDFLFLILTGCISIISGKEEFFRLKPVLTDGMLLLMICFSVHGRKNYFLEAASRYIHYLKLYPSAPVKVNNNLRTFCALFLFHILMVTVSAFFMSGMTWGLVSTVLFYLLVLLLFGIQFVVIKIENRMQGDEEIVPLVDERGAIRGKARRSVLHFNPAGKLLHPVVHLHVFNKGGELYLQKRPDNKLIQPGMWDTAVGGHIAWGETLEESLQREALEEISLRNVLPQFIGRYIWETDAEKELVFMFYTITESEPVYNPAELSEGRFWSFNTILHFLNKGIFTSNLEKEIGILKTVVYSFPK